MQAVKVTVVGDSKVGKTWLIVRYADKDCPEENIFTRFDSNSFHIQVDNETISLSLFDTASGEDYDRLRPLAYPQTDIFLICFSILSPESFKNVKAKWLPEMIHHCPDVPILLVGTKLDLRQDQTPIADLKVQNKTPITHDAGSQLALEIGAVKYLECSARIREGLENVFEEAVRVVLNRRRPRNGNPRPRCVLS